MARGLGWVAVGVVALGVVTWRLLDGAAVAAPAGGGTGGATVTGVAAVLAPAAAVAPGADVPAEDHTRLLALPDGSFVPALNGALGAPPLIRFWGNRPWSPIVGRERSDRGIDWYVHADGTRSTTQMAWRSDLGRMDAMTRVAAPGPAVTPAAGGSPVGGTGG